MATRPWWNQAGPPGEPYKVYMVIDHELPEYQCSWCMTRKETIQLLFYLNLLWDENQNLIVKGYEIITLNTPTILGRNICLILRKNKLFTEIRILLLIYLIYTFYREILCRSSKTL